jgi:uncharacterized protein YegP (UPF0339 family)
MAAGFELKGGKGKFSWNLKARNGRVILTSESYTTRAAAQNGIKSVRKHAASDKNFDRRKARNGAPYFVLTARNREVLGTSEMYASNAGREVGIASVKANAPDAPVHDKTM